MSHYFYGWYFRCQGEKGTIAVIPAIHLSPKKRCCSIQVITPTDSFYREFSACDLRINRKKGIMQIGDNLFSKKGIRMEFEGRKQKVGKIIQEKSESRSDMKKVLVKGSFRFGTFTVPKYDIMGPFSYIPGMECRHAVYSMRHTVNGALRLDDKEIVFQNGIGYMEGDCGTSFPERYIWSQSFFPQGAIMIAAASIPLGGITFTGTVGLIWKANKEYRFATYLGAFVKKMGEKELLICQGPYRLYVHFFHLGGSVLKAPERGNMTRTISENIVCGAEYTLTCKNRVLLHIATDKAAVEYEVKK